MLTSGSISVGPQTPAFSPPPPRPHSWSGAGVSVFPPGMLCRNLSPAELFSGEWGRFLSLTRCPGQICPFLFKNTKDCFRILGLEIHSLQMRRGSESWSNDFPKASLEESLCWSLQFPSRSPIPISHTSLLSESTNGQLGLLDEKVKSWHSRALRSFSPGPGLLLDLPAVCRVAGVSRTHTSCFMDQGGSGCDCSWDIMSCHC